MTLTVMLNLVIALQLAPQTVDSGTQYSNIRKYLGISDNLSGDLLIKCGLSRIGNDKYEQSDDKGTLTVTPETTPQQTEYTNPTHVMITYKPTKPTQISQEVLSGLIARSVRHELVLPEGKHYITTERIKSLMTHYRISGSYEEEIVVSLNGGIESMTISGR